MNREDIIRMALEAGFHGASGNCWPEIFNDEITVGEYSVGNRVERFAALVAAAERDKQAKIADDLESALRALVSYCNNVDLGWIDEVMTAEDALGAAIRARRDAARALTG